MTTQQFVSTPSLAISIDSGWGEMRRSVIEKVADSTGELVDLGNGGDERIAKAWALLLAGDTEGVFFMNSPEAARLIQLVRPTGTADLTAIVALSQMSRTSADSNLSIAYRRAADGTIDYSRTTGDATERSHIAAVLDRTFGAVLYTEQVMELGNVVGAMDVHAQARLRKAVGKNDRALINTLGSDFVAGGPVVLKDPETGELDSPAFSRQTASSVLDLMLVNAGQLVSETHARFYARLAYETAFLKANWPTEYAGAWAARV